MFAKDFHQYVTSSIIKDKDHENGWKFYQKSFVEQKIINVLN